jgi:hypothetical protein
LLGAWLPVSYKVEGSVVPENDTEAYGGVELNLHSFVTAALKPTALI